jgi:aspartyl-tRNA(Asn)/glutamyl-tRNA(Gln) amidotransferase subunit A
MLSVADAQDMRPAQDDSEPWRLSACELTDAYTRRALDPVEVLAATLARLEAVQPRIRALVATDPNGAREAAQASAARWRQSAPLSRLDGVVITVKDNIAQAGLPCRWGSRLYAEHRPAIDEEPVGRLRAAGAILLGKTNVPEFTLQGYTDNLLDGVTRNPWDPRLTPGGSSGGAVAAVASGIGPLALATDGGGSIRRPAGYTGLVGLKTSEGLVPRAHGLPEMLPGLEVVGPIARTLADLELALAVIAGPSPGLWREAPEVPGPLRIACWRRIGASPVDPIILQQFDAAMAALGAAGHVVHEAEAPASVEAFNRHAWPVLSCTGLAAVLRNRAEEASMLSPALRDMLARGRDLRAVDLFEAQRLVRELRADIDGVLRANDLILTPASAALPWSATEPHPREIDGQPVDGRGHAVFTAFVNACGLPALALPAPPHAHGLPIGLQLVGHHGDDARLLAVGRALEARQPWRHRWPTDL